MRTVNFRDEVMYVVARKMGYDPLLDFSSDMALSYATFVNLAVKKLYPLFDWPEWTSIMQFTPASHYVDYTKTVNTIENIGRVLRAYLRDPQVTDAIVDTPFKMEDSGVFCGFDHGTNIWLKFIKPPPQYSAATWSSSTTYALNQLAYDSTGGDTYISIQAANTNHAPASSPTWWTLVPFPEQIQIFVIRLAYAEALREEGRTQEADLEEKTAFSEAQVAAQILTGDAYDMMTDQSKTAPRYRAIVAPATASG